MEKHFRESFWFKGFHCCLKGKIYPWIFVRFVGTYTDSRGNRYDSYWLDDIEFREYPKPGYLDHPANSSIDYNLSFTFCEAFKLVDTGDPNWNGTPQILYWKYKDQVEVDWEWEYEDQKDV